MHQNSRHLISRLTWVTVFDSKAQGIALQTRLSEWSGFHLQQELLAIFDQFCPPEQTWKIESLELDLGTIHYDELESELPVKLRQELNEKLIALMLYPHQRGRYVEILDEKRSHIQHLSYFLHHGVLPWHYQASDGSVNQILALQLQNNQEELLVMLKELGLSTEQMRRRMAWQFNEPNMVKIIMAFEPNVGGQIIGFSNELTNIQQKATLVQVTSTADFKKNVWFWILNYLLTERGTVFNRIQFMKSSIKQMAAHYNMQYDELLELVELAVTKLNRSLNLQPDFILTLQLLFKEHKIGQLKKLKPTAETEDHWTALTVFLKDQHWRRTSGNVGQFNELVLALSKQDQLRFKRLLGSFGDRNDFWLPLINDLTDHSLKTIFISLNHSRSVVLTESIFFLNRLMGRGKTQSQRNMLWFKGLLFLLVHQDTSFKETDFFETLIVVLAQKQQCSTLVMLDQLLVAEVPTSLKTIKHTAIYQTLVAVFRLEVSKMPSLQFSKHLQQLMRLFHLQVKGGIKDSKRFETLKNILNNYRILEPKAFHTAFLASPYQTSLALIFPQLLKNKTTISLNMPLEIESITVEQANLFGQQVFAKDVLAKLAHEPAQLLALLKKEVLTEVQWSCLYQEIGFEQLLVIMGSLNQTKQNLFHSLKQLYQVLGNISFKGILAMEMQYLLFKKVSKAWISGHWKLIIADNIWNELIWEVCGKRGVSKKEFLARIAAQKITLPVAFKPAFEIVLAQEQAIRALGKTPGAKVAIQKPSIPVAVVQDEPLKGGINIRNAGLVLISSYLSMLFARLELTDGQQFTSSEKQLAAVHYLQYVVSGQTQTEEHLLPLNKLLCGLALSQAVPDGIALLPAEQSLIEGLIEAVIGHWPAIGSCSIDGFRGNWLVRDGLLTEKEDKWELYVEKKAYDLLIQHSPFSFSIIKYPWMDKPLHVNWPY